MKYILLLLIFVIFYYYFFYRKRIKKKRLVSEMVRDEVCQRYVLKKDALKLRIEGQEFYFCSEKCMKEFLDKKVSKFRS